MDKVTVGGLVFALPGLVLLVFALREQRKAKSSQEWIPVKATVIESGLSETLFGKKHKSVLYTAEVRYKYSVNTRSHESDILAFGYTGSTDREREVAIVEALAPGTRFVAYHDPEEPVNSVVVRGSLDGLKSAVFVALCWVSAASFLLSVHQLTRPGSSSLVEDIRFE